MLQLVLGIAGTGKTTWILDALRARAKRGAASVFLVPEQFSSTAETMVLQALGDAGSAHVEVVSFRTLAERILRAEGGENLRILTDAGRAVFVKRALDNVAENLRSFRKSKRDVAFCNLCAQTLTELKTAGAGPEALAAIAEKTGDVKLADLALIFEGYEAQLAGSAMDPDDRLNLAAERVGDEIFHNRACYIDNFDGFTAPEYKLLSALMRHCEQVSVTLCCDALPESEGGLGMFSPVRATARRLRGRAEQAGIPVGSAILLPRPRRSEVGELQATNLILAGQVPKDPVCTGKLTLTETPDRNAEVALAAAEMHRLAATGVPYSKMALVCRDLTLYESAVRRQLALYDIPWHCDAPGTIEYSAPVAFLRGALGLLRQGLVSGPILALLKTGLCGYAPEALAALENYVFTWRPKAADWRVPFEKHPAGLLQTMDDEAARQLELAEGVRREAIPILEGFIAGARRKNARELSIRLYRLLDKFGAAEHLEENALRLCENGEADWGERTRRAWDLAMEMLDQMAMILAGETVSTEEYDELFLLLVRSTDFGSMQNTLESAIFTSADRMRLADPDYCFVLGLCEGEFPSKVGYSGLLTHADRDLLVEHGVEMPGSFQNRILLEQMFLYRALTSARQGLHLSWPARHGGVPRAMSAELVPLQRLLLPGPLTVPEQAMAATPAAAFDRLATVYRDNTAEAATLFSALRAAGGSFADETLPLLREVDTPQSFTVSRPEALRRLTGEVLRISPTRAERYFGCRFAYFMEHVLHVRPRRTAELSPLESGTFVHYVLEQVLRETKGRFAACTDEEIAQLTRRFASKFIEANLPENTQRTAILLRRIEETTAGLLCYLRNWAQHSQFEIDALELPIGGEGGLKPLTLEGEDGNKMQVVGQVDRVDVLRKDGKTYLCVLDYKTGARKFNLDEVLYGLGAQMLVYMDVLCKQGGGAYKNAVPAGMLYLSADPAPESGARGDAGAPAYRLDGLLLDDAAILQQLDSDKTGLFLPVRYKQDGTPRAGKQLASLERIGGLSLYIEDLLRQMADGLAGGNFSAVPLVSAAGARHCDYCPYRASCRHENGKNETVMEKREELLEEIDTLTQK